MYSHIFVSFRSILKTALFSIYKFNVEFKCLLTVVAI